MKKNVFTYLLFAISVGMMVSCEPSNDSPEVEINSVSGVYITNEGGYENNNGSVSYYDIANNSVLTDPYKTKNGTSVGDIVQSFSIVSDSLGLIAANNSNQVKLIRIKDFSLINSCEINYPRYSLQIDANRVYVTRGSNAGTVEIINLKTMQVTGSIPVQNGPEHLVKSENYVFVANSGGWGQDSTVSVIDIATNKVTKRLKVCENTINLTVDDDGNVWVLSKGSYKYTPTPISGQSSIAKIDIKTLTVTESVKIGKVGDSYMPIQFSISPDKKTLYFTEVEGVYTLNIASKVISTNPIIAGNFYGMNVNPSTGDIYTFVVSGFTSPGTMYIYDSKGVVKTSKQVGIYPNGAIFK